MTRRMGSVGGINDPTAGSGRANLIDQIDKPLAVEAEPCC